MSESGDDPIPVRGRKRGIRNPDDYKRNIIKKARVKGTPYTNWSGNLVSARNDCPINLNW